MGLMNSQYRAVAPALVDQRQVYRHAVQIQRTKIRQQGKTATAGELIDVSIYGCRVASDQIFAEGARIWLGFDGGQSVPATAIWCKGGHVGCRFDETIDPKLFRALTLISE
ncbi:MAG: PilZ domain-containing protein [Parasphingorhabdus sp.]|uniref:PilZ domain-containing protein n=1 Tax=Parasphingorhabdus sp. TaxID=2709688 RepID=UPI00326513D8